MTEKQFDISSCGLHVLAMALMLSDHVWAAVFPNVRILTCIGRLAFPIFAFMIVEGYFHTRNFRKYLLRMLCFALISEIPFNLLYSGLPFYLFHQNVLWTFLIALLGIRVMELVRQKGKLPLTIGVYFLTVIVCALSATVLMTDFYGFGVLVVFTFYFFRGRKWWCFLGQLVFLWIINVDIMGGMYYPVELFGKIYEVVEQGLAMLALIPIWLYRGRKGYSSKGFQYFCYSFYPLHCLILGLYMIM